MKGCKQNYNTYYTTDKCKGMCRTIQLRQNIDLQLLPGKCSYEKFLTCIYTMSQKPSRSEHVTDAAAAVVPSFETFSHVSIKPRNCENFFFNRSCVCPTAALIKSLVSGGMSDTEHWIWSHSWHMVCNLSVSFSKTDLKTEYNDTYFLSFGYSGDRVFTDFTLTLTYIAIISFFVGGSGCMEGTLPHTHSKRTNIQEIMLAVKQDRS